jgi:putative aldouronate transport system substrate-binding protein
MKRILTLALALCMLCSLASAEVLSLKVLNPDLYPVADGASLDIWCGQDGNVMDYPLNPMNAALEALTGVKINWTTAPGTQADMNVMFNLNIASGKYPDVYLNTFETGDVMTYANDVFIPLNKYIENTYWIKQYLEAMPQIRDAITAPDGNIYSLWRNLPDVGDLDGYSTPYKLWIYKPWLEMSGMKMPTTIDEYREYLRYVRDHDMNGNGDTTDELPMMGSFAFDHDGSDPTYAVMQAFQLLPSNFLWADENNNVTCVAITDEFREGLKYLNGMYDEGLIPEDIYALTLNEFRDVVNVTKAEDMLVATTGAPVWARFATVSLYGERLYDDFTFMPVLKKDDNTPAQTLVRKRPVNLFGAVTVNCKDPQLAIDWIDACIDPEINRTSNMGIEGTHWKRLSAEGALPIICSQIPGTDIKDKGAQNSHTFGNWVFPGIPRPAFYDLAFEAGSAAEKANNIQIEANRAYLAASKGDYLPAIAWCDDANLVTEKAELQTAIENAISTAYAEFILGRKDIQDDAVWEAYKANLETLGLARYLEVVKLVNFGK